MSANSRPERLRLVIEELGLRLDWDSKILDFGCGAGNTVHRLAKAGYTNVMGFDIVDYRDKNADADDNRFRVGLDKSGRLPFDDEEFDVVISEEVLEHVMEPAKMLKELHRIMKPGSISIHVFPARYSIIEPHIYVPFGGVFAHHWYYLFWALVGIRNEFQKNLSAMEVANRNSIYFAEALNYVPNSVYESLWNDIGYKWKWIHTENFNTSHRASVRLLGRASSINPLIGWLYRSFHTRRVLLRKI